MAFSGLETPPQTQFDSFQTRSEKLYSWLASRGVHDEHIGRLDRTYNERIQKYESDELFLTQIQTAVQKIQLLETLLNETELNQVGVERILESFTKNHNSQIDAEFDKVRQDLLIETLFGLPQDQTAFFLRLMNEDTRNDCLRGLSKLLPTWCRSSEKKVRNPRTKKRASKDPEVRPRRSARIEKTASRKKPRGAVM